MALRPAQFPQRDGEAAGDQGGRSLPSSRPSPIARSARKRSSTTWTCCSTKARNALTTRFCCWKPAISWTLTTDKSAKWIEDLKRSKTGTPPPAVADQTQSSLGPASAVHLQKQTNNAERILDQLLNFDAADPNTLMTVGQRLFVGGSIFPRASKRSRA